MPKVRPLSPDEAKFRTGSGWGDSRAKAGVWFAEKAKFRANQKKVMDALKDEYDWIPLSGVIMLVNQKNEGIVLVAPNPSLPGIIALADGVTDSGTSKLQKDVEAAIQKIAKDGEIGTVKRGKK